MNRKEESVVNVLCGRKGGFYSEDYYGEEIVDEDAIKKLVELLADMHQFRPSFEAVKVYQEDSMSRGYLFKLFASIVHEDQRFSERYELANVIRKFVLRKEKDFVDYYVMDNEFEDIFLHFYEIKKEDVRYQIFCYLAGTMHYFHGTGGFDERKLTDNFGKDWWQLPVHC